MSTKNPPTSGSSFEQAGRKKNNLPVLVMIFLGLHAVVLGGVLWVGCKPHEPAKEEAPPPPVLPPLGQAPDTNAFFPPIAPAGIDRSGSGAPPAPGGIESAPIQPPPGGRMAPAPVPIATPKPEPVMPKPIPAPQPPGDGPKISPPVVGGTPRPAPKPAPSSSNVHIVARGDTYYSIASDHGTTVSALKAANPGVDPRRLQLGQKIKVPAPAPTAAGTPSAHDTSTYVVKSGDYLGKIAEKHKTTVAKLREVNGLSSDRIRVGQILKLPPGARR